MENKTEDECFCGFLSLRKGTRFILYISAIRLFFHFIQYVADEERGATHSFITIVILIGAVIIIALGIHGERTENSSYIKYFYYFMYGEAILIFLQIIIVLCMYPDGTNKTTLAIVYLLLIGSQSYFIWVVKRYLELLEGNVQQGTYQLPDEPPPFPV